MIQNVPPRVGGIEVEYKEDFQIIKTKQKVDPSSIGRRMPYKRGSPSGLSLGTAYFPAHTDSGSYSIRSQLIIQYILIYFDYNTNLDRRHTWDTAWWWGNDH